MEEVGVSAPRRLILVRHGRTALNAEGRLRGLADPPLDEVGTREARAVAEALAPMVPTVVLSSPLQRAVATADAIAAVVGAQRVVDARFNDRDYGPWTGALRTDVVERWGALDAAPGVESVAAVVARALPALDAVLDEYDGTVVVVTHDAVIRPVLTAIEPGLPTPEEPTGCWNELRRDSGRRWQVESVDQLP